jgi:hypothetical protein
MFGLKGFANELFRVRIRTASRAAADCLKRYVGGVSGSQQPDETNAETSDPDPPSADEDVSLQGPHAWLNWQAKLLGQPARTSSLTHPILVKPLWEEIGLYSDARIVGELTVGPYELMLAFPAREPALGRAELSLILRSRDHLGDPRDDTVQTTEGEDVAAYAGGDLGDQIASLLSLALDRRVRSGGVMRHGREGRPEGQPFYGWHHPPVLIPPRSRPTLPSFATEARLEDAAPYLEAYASLDGAHAVVLQRAAHQYADALWSAEADPRIAWIKVFGALEAAANAWAVDREPTLLAN